MDYQLTVISSNFVALLLIFSIALSIHVIIRYQEIQSLNPDASTRENTQTAVSQIVTPCLYMVLTTAIAFFSLTVRYFWLSFDPELISHVKPYSEQDENHGRP